MKIGYARVRTQDQKLELQIDALEQDGWERIYQEKSQPLKAGFLYKLFIQTITN